ncbi:MULTISPECIES: glutamine synthetase III [Croceibacter]|jgi:glutamine synthetase|uniref:Glutamine synthetase n=1 Tax=Croceibacter atlanticus (strain ATCC BAA-628 / JCM 21780 / CIP 108009 / IAM 15332 / KCTC 12090 / HTCC2559) TaxID=216432 RepID=A3U8M2_CROAH|nr:MULTISPECIES: glutamine synthetase III [Croceibacter]EAP88589.1 glutamine synthetase [Croceibacter atlanticus HTCC2559]MBG26558.1 glutamine synthetase type III [Croceibacter sp.]MBW4969281.1 glutamine synthetase III [Croceibacter atlanticus]WSP33557.1 glutamine synthetase III [Croceibacter atlanticus]|tara:strand:+ start:257429 stop:259612 length:2184 start_codon:yes stop_codon:yes gene_type:complete
MATLRFQALKETLNRPVVEIDESIRRSELFGKNVFNEASMRQYLTKDSFKSVTDAILTGSKISREVADHISTGMKEWAISKGATHYTHWFQPLTGGTAEKHDAFFETIGDGLAIEKFGGGQLVQQEPDASSFPNGGIRNTFEARGYTAWDPTSPAFVFGTTLCIPTVFVSYTGEALDNKTPLLRALQAVDSAATDVAKYFDKKVSKVNATLGWEQEYFLIDSALAASRPDLSVAGRTLLGHASAKGQQLDDHYFGSIPTRVLNYMRDLETQCMLLGIPVKTRHNEVAPNQFELAPIFEEANLAVDHNSLIMDVMRKVAERHKFVVLFHEKPFAGINGSGKHNNWSLSTDTGVNLLSPGSTPMKNLQFLTFFVNTIKAVCDNEELLRATIASASNDHRLGANEAPPAIISAFIGSQLTAVLDELEKVTDGKLSPQEKTDLKLNVVGKIPEILLDNTDRNRTSPFAFTGNKFEFRAVGSTANCAVPMTALNAMVAKQLNEFKVEVDALIKDKKMKKDDAIFNVLREYIKQSKKIRFEGDGYGEAWEKEAKKRGLSNNKTTPEALKANLDKKFIKLYEDLNIMNKVEIEARHEIQVEEYGMRIQIEGRLLGDIARNHVIPTAIRYQNLLIENVTGLKQIYGDDFKKHSEEQMNLIEVISDHIKQINKGITEMIEERKKANKKDAEKRAEAYCNKVKPYFDVIRYHCDKLELLVDDELWPLTKYRELLFTK